MFIDYLNKDINLIIKNRKNGYSLRVVDKNTIELKISPYYSQDIENILERHKRYIKNHISKLDTYKENVIHILGKEYDVEIINSDMDNILILDDINRCKIFVRDTKNVHKVLYDYYFKILEEFVLKNDPKIREAFNIKFKVNYSFKEVNTFYGKCRINEHHIELNLRLAKYEPIYILSVMCHEYAHFYVKNHQNEFYDLVEKVFKNYKKCQSDLRKIKYLDLY